jgi:MFS family permease
MNKVNVTNSIATNWLISLISATFFFYVIIDSSIFNIIGIDLLKKFHLTSTELGSFSSIYLWANALWLLPAGLFYDKFPLKSVFLGAFISCFLATFTFALSSLLWLDVICRLVAGAASAFAFLGCLRIVIQLFPPKKTAFAIGIVIAVGMSGGIFANTVFTVLVQHTGWRTALALLGFLGVAFFMLIFIVMRSSIFIKLESKRSDEKNILSLWNKITKSMSNKQNWLIGSYIGLLNLPIMMLAPLWVSWYLIQVYNLSMTQATAITSMIFFGEILGSSIISWLANQLIPKKILMYMGTFLSITTLICIVYIPFLTQIDLYVLFFMLGFFISTQVIGYPIIAENNDVELVSTAQGMVSTLVNFISATCKPLFGWILTLNWRPLYQNGIPQYGLTNYHIAFLLLLIAFILALFFCLAIKKPNRENNIDAKNNQMITAKNKYLERVEY